MMFLLGMLPAPASAQGFDGTGATSPPDGGIVADGLAGWSARFPGAPTVAVTGWAVDEPVVERLTDGALVYERPLVDNVFGASLQGLVPLSRRLALGLDAPIWLGTGGEQSAGGPAPGDWGITVPVRVVDGEGTAPRVLLVPGLRLPTGATARWLGEPGPVGSLTASAGLDLSVLALAVDGGLEVGPATGVPDWPGGLVGTYVADVGLVPNEAFGLHAELHGRAPLGRDLPGVPSEVLASVRVRPAERLLLTGAAGTAVTRGVGASPLRMAVGARVSLGRSELEALPLTPTSSGLELHVVDERRWPVRGATVLVDGVEVLTDDEGFAVLPTRVERTRHVDVRAEGFEPTGMDLAEGRTWWEVTLVRSPVPVAVSVVGPQGSIEGAEVTVVGEGPPGPAVVDEAGVTHLDLRPGTWTVTVSAPGMGDQQRTLVIEPARKEPIRVDAVLAPVATEGTELAVRVVDRNGAPVEDAVVALGDRDLGTTGTAGDLVVQGLAEGAVSLTVTSARAGASSVVEARIVPGTTEVEAVLEWPAGAVLVSVKDAEGRPVDARVAFAGPAPLPSRAVGSDGEELFVLRSGSWDLLVSAATLGTQQRSLLVDDIPGEVQEVEVVLRGDEAGNADLELSVQDLDGRPIGDAAVTLDGEPVGRTAADGRLVLLGLDEGVRSFEVDGDLLVPLRTELELVAGRQSEELVVWSTTGALDVSVTDPAGGPVDARVAFAGASALPSLQVGADGRELTVLPPGTWQVAVSHPSYGTRIHEVVVVPDERRRHVLDVRLAPEVEQTAKLWLDVRDASGAPVDAAVELDGARLGSTSGGRLAAEGLPLGRSRLVVSAAAMVPAERDVELVAETRVQVPLEWAPGALLVEVKGPKDVPVDAALVALAGPEPVAARQTVAGSVRFSAAPGSWWVMASHPDYAVAEQQVVLPETPGLQRVTLTLGKVDPRDARVVVSVRDEEGRPVEDVAVLVDGEHVGTTTAGGTFSLSGRPEGHAIVTLLPSRPGLEPRDVAVVLDRGEQDRHTVVLPSAPSAVTVTVVGGSVPEVVAHGPGAEPVRAPVVDGRATLTLPPGQWTLVAATDQVAGSSILQVRAGKPAQGTVTVLSTGTSVADGKLRLVHPILFDVGSAVLRQDAMALLDDVARRLTVDRRLALVEVQGHCSDEGGVAYNQQLSEDRARAVREALLARGVEIERLISRGYGLSRPVVTGHDESARQLNRRVELVIVDET